MLEAIIEEDCPVWNMVAVGNLFDLRTWEIEFIDVSK